MPRGYTGAEHDPAAESPRRKRMTRAEAKARTHAALLDAAMEVFGRYGFHGASIDMIAEAAGYTKGAVYAHFAGKEDLYLALLNKHLTEEGPRYYELIESGASFAEVRRQMEDEFPGDLERTRPWAVLTAEFIAHAMRDEAVRRRFAEGLEDARRDYVKSLRKRYEALGKAAPMDIDEAARAIMAFESGLSLLYFVNPHDDLISVYMKVLERLLD